MERMMYLIETINKAAETYYNSGKELISNYEYDALYDELVKLEKETGFILPNSPTQKVGYQVVDKLNKVKHEFPALSLDKTKDISLFPNVFNVRDGLAVIMWKLDGSTVIATYDKGKLTQLATRGNGEVGQDITHNAPYIHGLPMEIEYKGKVIVRGEALMSYKEFERINSNLPEGSELYKNPRNLANSTISLLDSRIVASRNICFKAFNLVHTDDKLNSDTFTFRLLWMKERGFDVVDSDIVDMNEIVNNMSEWGETAKDYEFPVDGLVVAANDVEYAESLPSNASKYPNKLVGYAFKWEDETALTTLREIEWSASRTGLLNPVAVFDPVELEGTTVTRSTLHNVSEVERLSLNIGSSIRVAKSNKIIPMVVENVSAIEFEEKNGYSMEAMKPIEICPVCGCVTEVVSSKITGSLTKTLWCKNPDCAAKHVGKFVHFCERDCMNIEGISEATIEKFVDLGWIKEWSDIYNLAYNHGKEIVEMEGFGQKSLENMEAAIEKSRHTSFAPFIHSLGINNIGKGQAKIFAKEYKGNVKEFFNDIFAERDFSELEDIGPMRSQSLIEWGKIYLDPRDEYSEIENLLNNVIIEIPEEKESENATLEGKIFVITGDVHIFKNRAELQEKIEKLGGKATGSVTSKTSYLINNDITSTSGKNKKAKELNIPVITEEEFMEMIS